MNSYEFSFIVILARFLWPRSVSRFNLCNLVSILYEISNPIDAHIKKASHLYLSSWWWIQNGLCDNCDPGSIFSFQCHGIPIPKDAWANDYKQAGMKPNSLVAPFETDKIMEIYATWNNSSIDCRHYRFLLLFVPSVLGIHDIFDNPPFDN